MPKNRVFGRSGGGVTLSLYTESTAYLAVAQNFAMRRTA